MINLKQKELNEWQIKNFGEPNLDLIILGMYEELGELSHALLKRKQGIRESYKKLSEDVADGCADIIVFGIQVMSGLNINFEDCLLSSKKQVYNFSSFKMALKIGSKIHFIHTNRNDKAANAFVKIYFMCRKIIYTEGLEPDFVISSVIDKVLKRDWTKNKITGESNG